MPTFLEEWVRSLAAHQRQELWEYFDGESCAGYDVPHREFLDLCEPEPDESEELDTELLDTERSDEELILSAFSRLSYEGRAEVLKKLNESPHK